MAFKENVSKNMKNNIKLLLASCCILFFSCDTGEVNQVGFNTAFENGSHGENVIYVSSNASTLYLRGEIELKQGEIIIQLIDPENKTVYSDTINAANNALIDESFTTTKGNWTLKYHSVDGEGNIVLRLSY